MKYVTKEYKRSMEKPMRNPSACRISFGNVDITASTDGSWVGSGTSWSETNTIDYSYDYQETIGTFELNRWLLDGSQIEKTTPYNDGFVSSAVSDDDGTSTAVLTKEFNNYHTASGLTLHWDVRAYDFPRYVTVKLYRDSTLVSSESIAPDSVVTEFAHPESDINKIVIEVDTSLPYTRLHLQYVEYGIGVIFSDDKLKSVSQSADVDPLSRRLPDERLTFTIIDYEHIYDPDNPKGAYAFINKGALLSVQFGYDVNNDGNIEWVKGDNYSLLNKPEFSGDGLATFEGVGILGSMTDMFYKSKLGSKNLYDMAVEVLEDANLLPLPSGDEPWDIDDSLQDMYTTSALPIASHAECLQLIAHASRSRLYTDDDNIIHIKPFGVAPDEIFDGEFTDTGHASWSGWATVDEGNNVSSAYGTFELNRWELDGKIKVMPNAYIDEGYVSSMSTLNGTQPATWKRTFKVTHDLPIIQIDFDTVRDEYPNMITVSYWGDNGAQIASNSLAVDSSEFVIDTETAIDCSYIIVTVNAMLPYYRARVKKVGYKETDFSLNANNSIQNTYSTTVLEKLKNVVVNEYYYSPSNDKIKYNNSVNILSLPKGTSITNEMTELYNESVPAGTTSLHIEFGLATKIQIKVTKNALVSSTVYARAVDLELSGVACHILILGVSLSESSVVHTYNYNVTGEDDIIENPLITNKAMADEMASWDSLYLSMRNTYEVDYRGNPEVETGDLINLQTAYTNVLYAMVLVDSIEYSGTLSGSLIVKELI